MDLKIKPVETLKLKSKSGTKEKIVYHINRDNKKTINSKMFRDTYDVFAKKYGANNLLIRGANNEGIFTFKGFSDDELSFIDFHEYLKNKVKSISEFDYFYSLEFTVLK
jgi:hypothetical protein